MDWAALAVMVRWLYLQRKPAVLLHGRVAAEQPSVVMTHFCRSAHMIYPNIAGCTRRIIALQRTVGRHCVGGG